MEGSAQANQGTPAEELADTAWNDREQGRSLTLRQLVAPDWYWFSGPAAYSQGAPLVNYLLRVFGPERFLKLYTTCQQSTFEADCRAILGIGLDELDAAFWADTAQIARRAGPPARVWLKSAASARSRNPSSPRIVPGPPRARRDHPEAGRRTIDRDAPRLVLAGVRRRRDQPCRWVRPGPGMPTPRPTGPAGGMKRVF